MLAAFMIVKFVFFYSSHLRERFGSSFCEEIRAGGDPLILLLEDPCGPVAYRQIWGRFRDEMQVQGATRITTNFDAERKCVKLLFDMRLFPALDGTVDPRRHRSRQNKLPRRGPSTPPSRPCPPSSFVVRLACGPSCFVSPQTLKHSLTEKQVSVSNVLPPSFTRRSLVLSKTENRVMVPVTPFR